MQGPQYRLSWFVFGFVVASILAVAVGLWLGGGAALEPLPADVLDSMVPIEVVPEIAPAAPGGPPPVERVRWRTVPGTVDPAVVEALARELAGDCPALEAPKASSTAASSEPAPRERSRDALPEMQVRVDCDGQRIEGLDADGRPIAGWVGVGSCMVRTGDNLVWQEIGSEPFDVTESVAESTREPGAGQERLRRAVELALGGTSAPGVRLEVRQYGAGRRVGWWASADYDLDPVGRRYAAGFALRFGR